MEPKLKFVLCITYCKECTLFRISSRSIRVPFKSVLLRGIFEINSELRSAAPNEILCSDDFQSISNCSLRSSKIVNFKRSPTLRSRYVAITKYAYFFNLISSYSSRKISARREAVEICFDRIFLQDSFPQGRSEIILGPNFFVRYLPPRQKRKCFLTELKRRLRCQRKWLCYKEITFLTSQ